MTPVVYHNTVAALVETQRVLLNAQAALIQDYDRRIAELTARVDAAEQRVRELEQPATATAPDAAPEG